MKLILLSIALVFILNLGFSQDENKAKGYVFTPKIDIKHTSVKNQYRSGTCWSFSGLGFFEAEILRKTGLDVDLSEMFVVNKNYHDKAVKYVRMHGKANLGGGGGFNDVVNTCRNYGLMTEAAYHGIEYKEANHVHGEMDYLLKTYAEAVVENKNKKISPVWIKGFDGILAAYLGAIPEKFTFNGKEMDARNFADNTLKLNMDEYAMITSFNHHPFYKAFALEIEDNWAWDLMYNLPLEDMMKTIDNALDKGYTVAWASDVSEKGFSWTNGVAIVPEQDAANLNDLEKDKWEKMSKEQRNSMLFGFEGPIKEKTITQEVRQEAFDNYETTDDHGMVIVGTATDQNGNLYYKIKNSWDVDQKYKGYFYASRAYVMYKTTSILVNKESIPKDISKKLNL